jgi:hypothetical protein
VRLRSFPVREPLPDDVRWHIQIDFPILNIYRDRIAFLNGGNRTA